MLPNETQVAQQIGDIFSYLPSYRVVVCTSCKFAVQPNAIPGHLQKHKIFRKQKRALLDELARIDLVAPSELAYPSTAVSPVPALSRLDGHRCLASDCHYLCASDKRMSQHWSQAHDCHNHRDIQSRHATLQTFFKGTQIRYFEVTSDHQSYQPLETPPERVSPTEASDGTEMTQTGIKNKIILTTASMVVEERPCRGKPFDIDAMMYLHFFTIATGDSLHLGFGRSEFWSHQLPREAAKFPYLMNTILCVAACHQACLATDQGPEVEKHSDAARRFYALALPEFRARVLEPSSNNSLALIAAARCLGIGDLVLSRLNHEGEAAAGRLQSPPEAVAELYRFLILMRGSLDVLIDLQEYLPTDSDLRFDPENLSFMQQFVLRTGLEPDGVTPCLETRRKNHRATTVAPNIFECLVSLPSKLVELGVATTDDVRMVTQCLGVLLDALECCQEAPSHYSWYSWRARQAWTRSVAVQHLFLPALRQGRPPAIIVLGLWIVLSLRPAEPNYWFTVGQCSSLIQLCKVALNHDESMFSLIEQIVQ